MVEATNSSPGCISAWKTSACAAWPEATRERGRRAFERGDALLERRGRRVGDAGIDVAERLQPEQRGGVVDVVEHEGGRLVDRRDARAGRRIGPRAGVDREGRETRARRGSSQNSSFPKLYPHPPVELALFLDPRHLGASDFA